MQHNHRLLILLSSLCLKMVVCSHKFPEDVSVISTTQNPVNSPNDLMNQFNKLELQINLTRSEISFKLQKLETKLQQLEEKMSSTKNKEPTAANIQLPENCQNVKEKGKVSGIYTIKPTESPTAFLAYCDMETRGGGWTYVLNRFDGSQDFYRKWNEYKVGFGNILGEFWIGLDNLYHLTGTQVNELLIELVGWDMKKVYAHYTHFAIGSEAEGYILKILGGFSGDAGDAFTRNAGQRFSTLDRDQDDWPKHCAEHFGGAWWYKACYLAHLTGKYEYKGNLSASEVHKGIQWTKWRGNRYSCKQARMMIRPRNSNN